VLGVELAEFVALSRLLHVVARRPVRSVFRALAVAFVAGTLVSLVNPDAFYADLLKPSLVALWLSQLIVFAVYPLFAVRRKAGGRPTARALVPGAALAAAAFGLMAYGLWAAVTTQLGT
jgi:hypothetical protein